MINGAARVIFGSDLSELSTLHFFFYLHSGGGLTKLIESHEGNQDRWVVGGAQQLCSLMASSAGQVHTCAPVREIRQDEAEVTVVTDTQTWVAKRVVVTVPMPMADRIRYVPPLPTSRDQMTQRVGMGATVKVLALYDEPFWRERGFSGEGVCTDGPVTVTFDNTTPSGQACLLTFIAGAPARGWAERSEDERRAFVLDTLSRYFGERALTPTHYLESDWAMEPFILGAPIATFPPGCLSVYGEALRAPVGRIHWAGTETALESTGFMEGALESGNRAAEEVLAALAE
jgi:monoamine oxidase